MPRPHPDDVLAAVQDADVSTPEEARELNERVQAMTSQPPGRPTQRHFHVCSTDDCRKHATLQEARDCTDDGCSYSAQHGGPHAHPWFMCDDHQPSGDDA